MDINTLSDIEIKAICYDRIALIEQAQAEMRSLNDILQKRAQQRAVLPKEAEIAPPKDGE